MNKLIAALLLTTITTTGQAACDNLASLLDNHPLPAPLDDITTLSSVTHTVKHCAVNFSYTINYNGVDKGQKVYDNKAQLELLRVNKIRIRHIYRSVSGRHMFSLADDT